MSGLVFLKFSSSFTGLACHCLSDIEWKLCLLDFHYVVLAMVYPR